MFVFEIFYVTFEFCGIHKNGIVHFLRTFPPLYGARLLYKAGLCIKTVFRLSLSAVSSYHKSEHMLERQIMHAV